MDPSLYLARIGYTEAIRRDVQTLQGLHVAHMRNVPFENLDIGLTRPIRLTDEALWEKIVVQKRGGFCYELNGLFGWLLRRLGFEVTHLNARVFNHRDGTLGIDFDHLALLVRVPDQPERWLVDVGFGDSFNEPLYLATEVEQTQGLRCYRLEQTPDGYITWQKNYDGSWERQYFVDLNPRNFPTDYEVACLYHQTSPRSSFTQASIISRATPEGRISLEDDRLILTRHGKRMEQPVQSKEEYYRLLKQQFNITLGDDD